MKKRIIIGLLGGLAIISTTGCGNKTTKPFTITCKGENDAVEGAKITNTSIYYFDKDQTITGYDATSVNVYDDDKTYEAYKEAIETTINNNTADVEYSIKTEPSIRTITLIYKVKITKEMLKNLKDKDYYNPTTVIERAETKTNTKAKCTIEGAKRSQLK